MKTIAIIGGGFSGTMTAVNLARYADQPLRAVVINGRRPFGRGTAFGTQRPEHLLNVAARNMSAFPDYPSHFFDWLRTRSEYDEVPDAELREMFVPRRVYGDYLRGLAVTYLHPSYQHSSVSLEVVEQMAIDIEPRDGAGGTVRLDNNTTVEAESILLATGNQPPAAMPALSTLSHDSRYCPDPWGPWLDHIPPSGGRIVLLGTGLTAVDLLITLAKIGWKGSITAVSRSGMLPRSHFRGIAWPDFIPASDAGELTLEQIQTLVEQQCERLKQMSQNPAIAIDKLRPHTQRLWQQLSLEDKQRFLREHAASWNVSRHRIAQSIHDRVTDLIDSGQLQVVAGTIDCLVSHDTGIEVRLRSDSPGGREPSEDSQDPPGIEGDLVVNCTGPNPCFSKTNIPLFQSLLRQGLVRPDALDMGIEVDAEFAVLQQDGNRSPFLYAMGPLLKGSLWETTAVPELRSQAMRVAQVILEQEPAKSEEYVIEYCI